MNKQIYSFNTNESPQLREVGGKALSLISSTKAGFPVPQGIVLTVSFFQPWIDSIKGTDQWKTLLQNPHKENCERVKTSAEKLIFTDDQRSLFNHAMEDLNDSPIFAIRSSSPEEDLTTSSFAGMYQTYLGTVYETLEEAIAKTFSSIFDFRVFQYKEQNGIGLEGTCISIIIQKQIASDVSGIGFSLNPLNNCYDEVVINASFGLGEAIVSGIVTPDMYIYDAVDKKILEKKINKKEIALWLKENGGIEEKENTNTEKQALKDDQIIELSGLIKKCEEFYGKPMDTEWAYEKGKLYLLQSRPITTYLPFFEDLLTKPGEKKKFYVDLIMLSQGFDEPLSVLGCELWAKMLVKLKPYMSPQIQGTAPTVYGRQYISVTGICEAIGVKGGAKFVNAYDNNLKRIFKDINYTAHIHKKKTEAANFSKIDTFKMIFRILSSFLKAFLFNYESAIKEYNNCANRVIKRSKELKKEDDFENNATEIIESFATLMSSTGVMVAGMLSQMSIKKMFKGDDIEKEIIALSMDLKGNPTSAMGYLLFKMASYNELQNTKSRKEFIKKCKVRNYSDSFMIDYDEFMEKYAVRGMKEIDVASKRVYEDVGLLYDKLKNISIEDNQITKVKKKRKAAYDKLLEAAKAKGKEKKFITTAEKFQESFGYREHPKYTIVYAMAKLHNICLEMANQWVKDGRLKEPYEVFDLHMNEIAKAQNDPTFDIMSVRKINLEGYEKVAHIKDWPLVIDSRGKIHRAEIEIKGGDIMGDPIAPGKITGRAKVLRSPYEKPLYPGEILIARATEPSWTPIFINAVAVIMEIGGPLQHGGIIAREYGIPCVSGLIGIMDIVKDGDLLEVDGYNGIIKIIEQV